MINSAMSAKEVAQLEGSPLSSVPTLHVFRYINCFFITNCTGGCDLSKPFVNAVLLRALLGHGTFSARQRISQASRQGRSRSTSNRSLSLVKPRQTKIDSWKSVSPYLFPSSYLLFSSLTLFFCTRFFLILYILTIGNRALRYCAGVGGVWLVDAFNEKLFFLPWNSRHSSWGNRTIDCHLFPSASMPFIFFSQPGKVLGL